MKIETSSLSLQASHAEAQQHEVRERLRMWVGPRPDFESIGRGTVAGPALPDTDSVSISDTGRARESSETTVIEQAADEADNDPRLKLIISMVEMLTGKKVRLVRADDLKVKDDKEAPAAPAPENRPAARAAGFGVEYDRHEPYTEVESTQFSAEGVIRTADGREIRFSIELSMQRAYHEERDVSLRLGDAARQKKDPLVINFAGTAAQLMDTRFSFDLDADGAKEEINQLASGSGFLALDLNMNGKIDDGSELFGTRSGDGFADLAAYDQDGNGWIDEGDAVYDKLRVWTRAPDGSDQLAGLAQTGVGAVSLARVATPFDLKTSGNVQLGEVRSTGVYLAEDGGAGTVQQVDLTI